jgi:HEAT repeat protein
MDEDDLDILNADLELENSLDILNDVEVPDQGPQANPDEMLALLKSPDVQQRMVAARVFCDMQDERATPLLTHLLTDNCPLVRVSAAYAIGRNPSPAAVEPLIHQLQTDWNGYVRKGIVWALGNCNDHRTLAPLLYALRTDISAVRLWAASSLAQMAQLGYETAIAAVPPLIAALKNDPIAAVRSNSGWSLGQICRELPSNIIYATAIDALIESLVEDPDMGVREDARASLLKVGDSRALQLISELEQEGIL